MSTPPALPARSQRVVALGVALLVFAALAATAQASTCMRLANPITIKYDVNGVMPSGVAAVALDLSEHTDGMQYASSTINTVIGTTPPGATSCILVVTVDVWPPPAGMPATQAAATAPAPSTTTTGGATGTTTGSTTLSTGTDAMASTNAGTSAATTGRRQLAQTATTTTTTTTTPSAGTNAGVMWKVYMADVSEFSIGYDSCDSYFSNIVSSKQAGATHYTIMKVCCNPTKAGDGCNGMTAAVMNSLWFGLPGGPADVAVLAGTSFAGAGPGFTDTVAPVSIGPSSGARAPSGPSSDTASATYSTGALAGAIIGAIVGSALLTATVTWFVMSRRSAMVSDGAGPMSAKA